MHYQWKYIAITFIALCAILLPAPTTAEAYDDVKVKAAFIYRLLHFVEQPASIAAKDPITLCILGRNPFSQVQQELVKHKLGNRVITLVEKHKNDIVSDCQVLYISDSEKASFSETITPLQTHPVLTISDINQFARYGGMIGFTEYNHNLRLEINTKALAQAQFQIDPHLLEVALHVYE